MNMSLWKENITTAIIFPGPILYVGIGNDDFDLNQCNLYVSKTLFLIKNTNSALTL